jgi:hypothetical protein
LRLIVSGFLPISTTNAAVIRAKVQFVRIGR